MIVSSGALRTRMCDEKKRAVLDMVRLMLPDMAEVTVVVLLLYVLSPSTNTTYRKCIVHRCTDRRELGLNQTFELTMTCIV